MRLKPSSHVMCFEEITALFLGWDFSHLPLNTVSVFKLTLQPREMNMP